MKAMSLELANLLNDDLSLELANLPNDDLSLELANLLSECLGVEWRLTAECDLSGYHDVESEYEINPLGKS